MTTARALVSKVSITTGSKVPLEEVIRFGQLMYGPGAYQGNERFYRWAYEENPNCPSGMDGLLLARTQDGRLAGMMNRLFIEWDVRGGRSMIPALGDFSVAPEYRNGGLGLRLALAATSGLEHAFVNGSNPNSSPLFRALKYEEIKGGMWFRKMIRPVHAMATWAWGRTVGTHPKPYQLDQQHAGSTIRISTDPDDELLSRLADLLNTGTATARCHWTMASLRWRFFHPFGPRHAALFTVDWQGRPDNLIMISLSVRKGLKVCRAIAHSCRSGEQFAEMMKDTIDLLRRSGIHVFMAFTFEKEEAKAYRAMGMTELRKDPGTFLYQRRKAGRIPPQDILVQGAASDLGMDALF